MLKNRINLTGSVLAGALTLSACDAGSTEDPNTNTSGTLAAINIGLVAEPPSLDFTTADGAAIPQALLYNVYETLLKVDDATGDIVPALATDYKVSDDGLTYTFTLVQDATFSNGADFTAQDAAFSIERVKSDAWTVSLKNQMAPVKSAEATGDHELTVTLTRPDNSWLYAMTTSIGAMFDTDGVDDLATKPIGTGPYAFKEWDRGTSITMARNNDYWGDAPYFEDVTLTYFGQDANALNSAMLTGAIDVIGTVQAPQSLVDFEDGDYQVIEGTTNGEVVLSFNNTQTALRRARSTPSRPIRH